MSQPFIFYDPATGVITSAGTISGPIDTLATDVPTGESVLLVSANPLAQYVDLSTSQIVDKPEIGGIPNKLVCLSDAIDEVVISGLPNPTTADVDGEQLNITDGSLELTFDLPGTYTVVLSALHRMDQEIVIDVT